MTPRQAALWLLVGVVIIAAAERLIMKLIH